MLKSPDVVPVCTILTAGFNQMMNRSCLWLMALEGLFVFVALATPEAEVIVCVLAVLLPVVVDCPEVQLKVDPNPRNPAVTLTVLVSWLCRLCPIDDVAPSVVEFVNPLLLLLPGAA